MTDWSYFTTGGTRTGKLYQCMECVGVYWAWRTGRRPSAERTESTCKSIEIKVLTNLLSPALRTSGMT